MKLQSFYKLFTWLVLALIGVFFSSTPVSSRSVDYPNQNSCSQDCCRQQLIIFENSADKAIHIVHDFVKGNVTIVVIRKG